MENEKRTCLSCKGTGYVYNYRSFRYTMDRCGCCTDGKVPFKSADDGFGPWSHVQHIRETDLYRNGYYIGGTTDIRDTRYPVEEATIRLNGLFTVQELQGIAGLLHRIRDTGSHITCDCCRSDDVPL